uniref:7TM_GPCR_Srx domain-containing protein n=2 Tax=Bursaphelenchus xylophilus TaxID=6326 RepID=A0A1I7SHJ6_BURXY
MEGPLRFAPWHYQILGMFVFCTVLALAITILPAQFFYRYYTMTTGGGMSKLNSFLLFSTSYCISIPLGIMAYFAYGYSATVRPGFNYGTLWYPEVPLPTVIYADTRHQYLILYFGIGGVVVTVCYQLVVLIGYKTVVAFNEQTRKFTTRAQSTQNQLTYFLIIQ